MYLTFENYLNRKTVTGAELVDDPLSYIEFAQLFPDKNREFIDASYLLALQHMIQHPCGLGNVAREKLDDFLDRHNADQEHGQEYQNYWTNKHCMDSEFEDQERTLAYQEKLQRLVIRRVKRSLFLQPEQPVSTDMDFMVRDFRERIVRSIMASFR